MAAVNPPRPYLTREETNERLEKLGFEFDMNWNLRTGQADKLVALQELMAGAIAEWVGLEFSDSEAQSDAFASTAEQTVAELQEWTEEYLVG